MKIYDLKEGVVQDVSDIWNNTSLGQGIAQGRKERRAYDNGLSSFVRQLTRDFKHAVEAGYIDLGTGATPAPTPTPTAESKNNQYDLFNLVIESKIANKAIPNRNRGEKPKKTITKKESLSEAPEYTTPGGIVVPSGSKTASPQQQTSAAQPAKRANTGKYTISQWLAAYVESQGGLKNITKDPVFGQKIQQVAADIQKNKGKISSEDGKVLWDALWQYSKLAGMNRGDQQTGGQQAPAQQAAAQQQEPAQQGTQNDFAEMAKFFKMVANDPSVLQDRTYKKFTDYIKALAAKLP